MTDCYFYNITTKGAGAIVKQVGKDYKGNTLTRVQIYRSFALNGGVFDLDW